MNAFEVIEDDEEPETAKKPKKKRKQKAMAEDDAESAINREMRRAVDLEIEKVEEEFGEGEAFVPEMNASEQQKKRKKQLAIGGVALLCLAVGGYVAFSGDSRPKPQLAAPAPRDPEPPAPEPEEKKPEPPKKVEPKVVVKLEPQLAPLPRVVLRDPLPIAASRMLSERAGAATQFDKTFVGKVLQIYGTCGAVAGESIQLADREDEKRNAILCSLRVGEMPPTQLQPGQAVAIRGIYEGDLRMTDCEVVRITAPADEDFKDKEVEITGIVSQGFQTNSETPERFPTLVLEPPLTDTLISIRCLFRPTEKETLAKLRPGQPVTVRGRCEGRSFRVVRLHDCSLVSSEEATMGGAIRAKAERFFAAYEADLLPVPRPDPAVPPVIVSAEQLAVAFSSDLPNANATYRYKNVEVSGKVVGRFAPNTVVLETGTNDRYQVAVVLMPLRFAALRDEKSMTLRGTCVGVRGAAVRVENGERYDADAANPAVRTVAEYLPLQASRELQYESLSIEKAKDNPITQFQVSIVAPDTIRSTPLRTGISPSGSLFGESSPQVRWLRDFTKSDPKGKLPPPQSHVTHYRLKDGLVELRDIPPPPAQPSPWWDPVFRSGLKRGESWTSEMPSGQTVTYTVVGFSKDQQSRHCVELSRVVKSPMEPETWEESRITYALGVGEIRRVVSWHATNGRSITKLEMRLVESMPAVNQPKK